MTEAQWRTTADLNAMCEQLGRKAGPFHVSHC